MQNLTKKYKKCGKLGFNAQITALLCGFCIICYIVSNEKFKAK